MIEIYFIDVNGVAKWVNRWVDRVNRRYRTRFCTIIEIHLFFKRNTDGGANGMEGLISCPRFEHRTS